MRVLCLSFLLLALAGCSSGLHIDDSHTATGQNSRVQCIVLHYTSTDMARSLQLLTETEVSSHYLIGEAPPTIYRMLILYLLSGVGGFLLSYLAGVPFTIGASAAVCGLIGALIYFGKARGGVYGNMVYRQIGGWAVGLLIIGLMPGINNWGHAGGFLTGIGLAFLLGYQERRPETFTHKAVAGICALGTLVVLGGAAGFGTFYTFFG